MPFGDEQIQEPPAARVSAVIVSIQKFIARNENGTDGEVTYVGSYVVRRESATGVEVSPKEGKLMQHLTPAQINALKTFIDSMHTKAITETIP